MSNNILKAKQILLFIYLGFDKLYNAFQGSQVLAEGRLWGEVSWKGSRDTQEWRIFSQVTKEDVISFNWSCLCRTNTAPDTAGEGEGSSFRKDSLLPDALLSKEFYFFFPGEGEKTSCNDSELSQAFCQTQPLPSSSWTAPISANW